MFELSPPLQLLWIDNQFRNRTRTYRVCTVEEGKPPEGKEKREQKERNLTGRRNHIFTDAEKWGGGSGMGLTFFIGVERVRMMASWRHCAISCGLKYNTQWNGIVHTYIHSTTYYLRVYGTIQCLTVPYQSPVPSWSLVSQSTHVTSHKLP